MQVFAKGSEGHQGASLCYEWGKVKDHNAFILFGLGSTHNFILQDMAAKLDIHSLQMGPKEEAKGALKGQQVPIIPLIGKLQL